jgi:hypothetical protein
MASAWLTTRTTGSGAKRYRVEWRAGGREAPTRYGGSFKTKREADERKRWISGELAARRVPDLTSLETESKSPTLTEAAERWFASRVDVAANTKLQHRSAMRNLLAVLGSEQVDRITPADVSELVTRLSETRRRETVRKSLLVLGMVLDHAGIEPNPARAKSIKLPGSKRPRSTRQRPSTSKRLSASSPLATDSRRSCSSKVECGSVNSRRSTGATSTSRGSVGASRRAPARRARRAGSRYRPSSSRPLRHLSRARIASLSGASSRASAAIASARP